MNRSKQEREFLPLKRNSYSARPKEVGRYLVGEKLGNGSFGTVKEACDRSSGRVYAIKIVKKQNLNKAGGGEESIAREVEILRRLHHLNCIRLFDFFENEEKSKIYIVCERAGGGSVKSLCERAHNKRLPLLQARMIFAQVLDALEYLHRLNIFHRDLKPDNILLTPDGTVKVSDFGVALQLDKENKVPPGAEKCRGSPAFQPPEIIAEKGNVFSGSKIDIWASGITLYMMCIGVYPFEGSCVKSLFESISNVDYEIPDWVDPLLADLIRSILVKDYKARFSVEQIRKHGWMHAKLKCEKFIPVIPTPSAFKQPERSTCCTIL